ncbi:hypothetical protein [Spirosoma luteum]|uniref:hypothetical protein n=1 Tax=Spirosoma luteum TaxID=431553 RepID=UPI00146AE085|nr:hypothetical protein [Spirosoma luteum]
MKKVLSILFVGSMLTFAACESKKTEETTTTEETTMSTDTATMMADSSTMMSSDTVK